MKPDEISIKHFVQNAKFRRDVLHTSPNERGF